MHATLHEQPPALAGSPAIVAFDRVIRRALAKSPADRYATAEAMSRDLAGIVLGDSGASAAAARALTRLVVLPFRVLRSDPEVDFLGLALADAVSSSLSGLSSLVVRSSAAGSRFAVEAPDLRGHRHAARRGPRPHGHPAALGGPPAGLDPARGGSRGDPDLVAHDGVGGGRRLSPAGRAHAGDRRVAHAAPSEARRGPSARARLRPARAPTSSTCAAPRSPATGPAAGGAGPLPPLRGGGSRLRPRLGAPRAGASPDRQVPGDPRARHASGPGGGGPAPGPRAQPAAAAGAQALRPPGGGDGPGPGRHGAPAAPGPRRRATTRSCSPGSCTRAATRACSRRRSPPIARPSASIPTCPRASSTLSGSAASSRRCSSRRAATGRRRVRSRSSPSDASEEALEAWETVARAFSPQTPVVREWVDGVREFLSLVRGEPSGRVQEPRRGLRPRGDLLRRHPGRAARDARGHGDSRAGRRRGLPVLGRARAPSLDRADPRTSRLRGRPSARRAGTASGRSTPSARPEARPCSGGRPCLERCHGPGALGHQFGAYRE